MSERHIHPGLGQLTSLPQASPDNPLAIDPRTRERGLQHVTEIRRGWLLEEHRETPPEAESSSIRRRRQRASMAR